MFYFLGSFLTPYFFVESLCHCQVSKSIMKSFLFTPEYPKYLHWLHYSWTLNFQFDLSLLSTLEPNSFSSYIQNFYTTEGYENCNLTPKNLASVLSLWPCLSLSKENSIPSLFTFFYISVGLISLLTHAMPMLLCTCYHYRSLMK